MRDDSFNQMNLFNFNREYKKITKPVRLIEFFSGLGAQARGLQILGVPFEHYKTCEWAAPSIEAYNAIHLKDWTDYSKDKTKEELIQFLDGNISTNYDEPCNVHKKNEEWLRRVYNNCIATHNLMNIMKVHGDDLEIVETDKYEYIVSYSFPCQDLSNAGQKRGMSVSQKDGGTRSGLLWEVERILTECENKPQILLMENVPEVIGIRNIKDFQKWEAKLTQLGYTNYVGVLNAKNYGIPQNRRRCFMISILGDYSYDLPKATPLKYLLEDLLEEGKIDEKYYLSDAMIKYITADNEKWTGNNGKSVVNREIGCCVNTGADGLPANADLKKALKEKMCEELIISGKVRENDVIRHSYTNSRMKGEMKDIQQNNISPTLDTRCDCLGVVVNNAKTKKVGNYGNGHHAKDVYDSDGVSPTITTGNHGLGQTILIKNATKQGYLEAEEGDGVDISTRMEKHRGTVQKGLAQTLTCAGGANVGVVVKETKNE